MGTHYPLGDVEPQTGALADGLGREERLEDTLANRLRYSGTVVHDVDSKLAIARLDDHPGPAPLVHGVDGIVDEIGPDLI